MPAKYKTGSASEFEKSAQKMIDNLRAKVFYAMQEVIRDSVSDMKRYTESRPSEQSGRQGRVDSGDMLADIAGDTFWDGVDKIVGQFGFTGRQQLYYILQSGGDIMGGNPITGFTHVPDGAFIESTFAMRDSAQTAIDSLIEKLGEAI